MSSTPAVVVDNVALTARLRRVRLRVHDLAALALPAAGDCALGVYFRSGDDGPSRTYSVRRQEGPILTLDIAVHTGGPGSRWATAARPGNLVRLDHARSWYRPDPRDRQLLVADLSGLPAAARIIDELGPDVEATLLAEVPGVEDLDYLPMRANVTVIPVIGSGNGYTPSELAEHLRSLPIPRSGAYCWFGGEAGQSRAARKYLRALGWSIRQYDLVGYWRSGSDAWDARFARVADHAVGVYRRALSQGKSDKEAMEEFDVALERLGL